MSFRAYNPEIKLQFINERYEGEEKTQKTIKSLFNMTSLIEKQLNKDIFDMNYREIDTLAQSLGYLTENTLRANLSYISLYVNWAIQKGLTFLVENNVALFLKQEDMGKYVSRLQAYYRYISRNEFELIYNQIVNTPDQLLWLGIYRGLTLHELQTLTKKDIVGNSLFVTDKDGTTREFKADDEILQLVKNSLRENVYYSISDGYIGEPIELVQSEYVMRPTVLSKNNMMSDIGLRQRFKRIVDSFDLKVTPQSLQDSYYIQNLVDYKITNSIDELELDDFNNTLKQLGLSRMQAFSLRKKYNIAMEVKGESFLNSAEGGI